MPLCRKKMGARSAGPKCGNYNHAAESGRRWDRDRDRDEMEGRYQRAVLAPYKSGRSNCCMVCFLRHRGGPESRRTGRKEAQRFKRFRVQSLVGLGFLPLLANGCWPGCVPAVVSARFNKRRARAHALPTQPNSRAPFRSALTPCVSQAPPQRAPRAAAARCIASRTRPDRHLASPYPFEDVGGRGRHGRHKRRARQSVRRHRQAPTYPARKDRAHAQRLRVLPSSARRGRDDSDAAGRNAVAVQPIQAGAYTRLLSAQRL